MKYNYKHCPVCNHCLSIQERSATRPIVAIPCSICATPIRGSLIFSAVVLALLGLLYLFFHTNPSIFLFSFLGEKASTVRFVILLLLLFGLFQIARIYQPLLISNHYKSRLLPENKPQYEKMNQEFLEEKALAGAKSTSKKLNFLTKYNYKHCPACGYAMPFWERVLLGANSGSPCAICQTYVRHYYFIAVSIGLSSIYFVNLSLNLGIFFLDYFEINHFFFQLFFLLPITIGPAMFLIFLLFGYQPLSIHPKYRHRLSPKNKPKYEQMYQDYLAGKREKIKVKGTLF